MVTVLISFFSGVTFAGASMVGLLVPLESRWI